MRGKQWAHRLLSVGRVPSPPTLPEVRKAIGGGRYLINLSCWDQYLAMVFAQLTYRESLRDIEACLGAIGGKLYHMGFRTSVARSTLADANESRDWRIFADFAYRLIATARGLYARDPLGVDLDETLYA